MFCVECGSEEKLYGPICKKCLLSKGLIQPPEYISVHVCPACLKVMDGSVSTTMPSWDVAAQRLSDGSSVHAQVERLDWEVPEFPPEKGEHRVVCRAMATVAGDELSQDFEIGIRVRHQKCASCSRQSGDYYEAIIQLRLDGLDSRDSESELAQEDALVQRMVNESSEENGFITRHSAVKGGMDYYLGSAALARIIANKFRNRFGARINESPSLVGMKDGRDMYRYTILVRLPSYREGDVVSLERKVHVVESVGGKQMSLRNAADGQIARVSPDDPSMKLVAKRSELRHAVVVTHDRATVQLLDPDSMSAVTLLRPQHLKKVGETVPVVRFDEMLHIV